MLKAFHYYFEEMIPITDVFKKLFSKAGPENNKIFVLDVNL
jgi:hypothetical protein